LHGEDINWKKQTVQEKASKVPVGFRKRKGKDESLGKVVEIPTVTSWGDGQRRLNLNTRMWGPKAESSKTVQFGEGKKTKPSWKKRSV